MDKKKTARKSLTFRGFMNNIVPVDFNFQSIQDVADEMRKDENIKTVKTGQAIYNQLDCRGGKACQEKLDDAVRLYLAYCKENNLKHDYIKLTEKRVGVDIKPEEDSHE